MQIKYRIKFGQKLNLKNPKTFNEKLQWLKLHDRKDFYSTMVDKHEVKDYVANIIGNDYIIPTLDIYDHFDEIDFDKLPSQFVIKCTHDSGGVVVVQDKKKLDITKAKEKINKRLKNNFFYAGREWPYKNVNPRIIIEKFLTDSNKNDLMDYKFFVFNGRVEFFKIDFDRFTNHRANYYDRNAKLLKFGEACYPPDYQKNITPPKNLQKMIDLAEKLSSNIPFVRVDFYNINGAIYFGEITFFPASGFGKFVPEQWDKKLGDLINLDTVKK